MSDPRLGSALLLCLGLLGVQGCGHCRKCCSSPCGPEGCPPPRVARFTPGLLPPHPLTPVQSAPVIAPAPAAPAPLPTAPPPPTMLSPQPPPPPAQPLPPADARGAVPESPVQRESYSWQGSGHGSVRLSPPETPPASPDVRLRPPETPEPPLAPAEKPRPSVTEERSLTPSLPVGIPQFAAVQDGVTAGLKPSLDGLDWLRARGYRTVLHLRRPAETDTADQKVVESRGLKYVGLDVSPMNLAQVMDEFNRTVGDTAARPLFVYDKDGALAGPLWYLRFRTVDRLTEEEARRKATALGLREDGSDEVRTMWVAVQDYLRKNLP